MKDGRHERDNRGIFEVFAETGKEQKYSGEICTGCPEIFQLFGEG